MPAILTHKAITLLARDRLAHLHGIVTRQISRKQISGIRVSQFEQKLAAMSGDAVNFMGSVPLADNRTMRQRDGSVIGSPDLLRSISKFAVMGSMGPDLPAFAHFFQPGQGWAFDTIHKGTPDYNRERVIARTTDMALAMHRLGEGKISTVFRNSDIAVQTANQTVERNKLRAYIMGHMCHVAADVISHPFVNDVEWHSGVAGTKAAGHAQNELKLDAAVAKNFFRRSSTKSGQGWDNWWPGEDEIAPYFFEAYTEAFAETYGADRIPGFKDFEDDLVAQTPPEMTPEFMRHGYKTFRGFGVSFGYGWSFWEWFGMLSPLMVPAIFAPLIGQALPHGSQFFQHPTGGETERTEFELLSLPLASGALSSLIVGGMLLPYSRKGDGEVAILGIVANAYTLATWMTGLIESTQVEDPDDGIPSAVRWGFFFALPMFFVLPFMGELIEDGVEDYPHPRPFSDKPKKRQQLVDLANIVPLGAVFGGVMMLLLMWAARAIAKSSDDDIGPTSSNFWVANLLWMLLLGGWVLLSKFLDEFKVPETSSANDDPLRKHGVRLFDDQTLFTDPASPADAPVAYYASDLRPLAKLWWEGAGDMTLRSDRFGLTFKPGAGAAASQTVPGPMTPMTVAQYLQLLQDIVVDSGGTAGGLRGVVFDAEEIANYPLPTGAAFAAHGDFDRDPTEADIIAEAATFKPLGNSEGSTDYILYHAPKPQQAVLMAPDGTFQAETESGLREIGAERGYRYVVDSVTEDSRFSDALMSQAADLGALLCMGTTQHIADAPVGGERVYQVFRNWSLDRRRINEWKILVTGGARSDKTADADRYDAAMPQGADGPDPATWQAPIGKAVDPTALAEAEQTARGFGWIPTLREFVRLVEEGEDIFSTNIDPVRPDVPTPRAVTRAMAYLVDAPDPVEV